MSDRNPSHRRTVTRVAAAALAAVGVAGGALTVAPAAAADEVAYLVNVTVRPGYNFPNAEAALGYGRFICGKVANGDRYPQLIADTKRDFHTNDEYQAAYLINQAVNELCPAQIWQLRNSAAGYRPGDLP
ncbi:DUF732 domain-containing protein [Mycolicibacterium thermoresistibile]